MNESEKIIQFVVGEKAQPKYFFVFKYNIKYSIFSVLIN